MPGKTKRPVYLNLLQIRLPVAGTVSIAHRAAGLLLVLALPLLLAALELARSEAGYARLLMYLEHPLPRLLLLAGVWALAHHFFAGLRFLLADMEIGLTKPLAQAGAWAVHAAALLCTLLAAAGLFL